MQVARVSAGNAQAVVLRAGNVRLVFDVASSDTFDLDDHEAEALAALSGAVDGGQSLDAPILSRLQGFVASGALFGPDSRRKNPPLERKLRLYEVIIQLAYTCNMACTYCYADKGEYGGGQSYLMSNSVARDTVDFVLRHRGSNTVGFGLLGGEPLLNLNTLQTFVKYARKRGLAEGVKTEFSVTTNGLPLSQEVIEFLKEHQIAVRMSIDGTRAIHDKYRPDKKHLPTYDRIQDGAGRRLRQSGLDYIVRSSMFGPEAEHVMDQVRTLFEDYGYTRVKVDFLWGNDGTPGIIEETDLPRAIVGIDALGAWFRERVLAGTLQWNQLLPFAKYIGRLRAKPTVSPVYLGQTDEGGSEFGASVLENNGVECGAGVNVISVSANGDIYSCHRTEGNPDYKIGSIYDGVRPDALEYWHSRWRLEEADCRTCWARYVCIGGCPAFGVYKHNDPMQVDHVKCQIRRRFIAWSVVLHHEMQCLGISINPSGSGCTSSCGERCDQE